MKKLTALALALIFALLLIPSAALAQEPLEITAEAVSEEAPALPAVSVEETPVATQEEPVGTIRVIVENTTFTKAIGGTEPAFTGLLVDDAEVPIYADTNMLTAVEEALKKQNIPYDNSNGYFSTINGLSESMAAAYSGWMLSLNDWFTAESADKYTVASKRLQPGDVIRVMHTMDFNDLGGYWDNNDKSVKSIEFDGAMLRDEFKPDVYKYNLYVLKGATSSILVTPTASNKNFQVRTSVNGEVYSSSTRVPVQPGTVIQVECGNPEWPTMNGDAKDVLSKVYKFTVVEHDALTEPEKPTNFKAEGYTNNSVYLSWNNPTDGQDGVKYAIYRSTNKKFGYKAIASNVSRAIFIDSKGLKKGTTYYYKVKAYVKDTEATLSSKPAGPISAQPGVDKPGSLKATAAKQGAKITWKAPRGADAYMIYRSEKKTGGYKLVKTTKAKSFTDSKLKAGKLYYYKVIPYYTAANKTKVKGRTAGPVAVRPK